MRFYSVSELAIFCKKSERTIYRKLEALELDPSDIKEDPKRYSENVLKLLQGKESTMEINFLKKEIENLKFTNDQLSTYAQQAFDRLKQQQQLNEKLSENLKASQLMQHNAYERVKELESKIRLLESSLPEEETTSKKKKKKKKKKKLF